jgi:deoxyhypusine synthase
MYNCLQEMEMGRLHKITFSSEAYEGCYDEIMESIEDLLKSDNAAEFNQQLKEWAGVKG